MYPSVCIKLFSFPSCLKHSSRFSGIECLITTPISSHTTFFFAYYIPDILAFFQFSKPSFQHWTFWVPCLEICLLILLKAAFLWSLILSLYSLLFMRFLLQICISQLVLHLLFIFFLPHIIISCYFTYLLVLNCSPKRVTKLHDGKGTCLSHSFVSSYCRAQYLTYSRCLIKIVNEWWKVMSVYP